MADDRSILRVMAKMPEVTKKDIFFVAAKLMGIDAKWDESKHKRDKSGKFTSGSGNGGSSEKREERPEGKTKAEESRKKTTPESFTEKSNRSTAKGMLPRERAYREKSARHPKSKSPPADSNGIPFLHRTAILPKKEFGKVMGEINSFFHGKYANEEICVHVSIDDKGKTKRYFFENHGYQEYNIYEVKEDA